jgi:hypothetical protein
MFPVPFNALAVALCSGGFLTGPEAGRVYDPRLERLVASAGSMCRIELNALLQRLGRERDFNGLRAIYESDVPEADVAAGEYARRLSPEEAVRFCSSFPVDSWNWRSAFYALRDHPKPVVLPYVLEMSRSPKVHVRYYCYRLCIRAGWDELAPVAAQDLKNETSLKLPCLAEYERTIGDVAEQYLKSLKKGQ